MTCRMQEMCLTKTDAAIEKQWVVALERCLSYRFRGCVSELVRASNDEIVEPVSRIELWLLSGPFFSTEKRTSQEESERPATARSTAGR